MKLAYLGPTGTHSQAAAETFAHRYLHDAQQRMTFVPMVSLAQILESVEDNAVDLGCIPVENALEGSVAEVLDSLALKLEKTRIVAEFVRPIQHALIRRYEFWEGIQFIHSHPQAIGQCRDAIYARMGTQVKFVPASSTSEAVKALLTLDETHAAIGSVNAARHYGMEVLEENIGNLSQNATRFLMISAGSAWSFDTLEMPLTDVKTSLCVGLKANRPGALLQILTAIAQYDLNLSKIESRPSKKCLGEYLFYLDIEGLVTDAMLNRIREETAFLKVLGVYPVLGVLGAEMAAQAD